MMMLACEIRYSLMTKYRICRVEYKDVGGI